MGSIIFDITILLTLLWFCWHGLYIGLIQEIAGIAGLVCGFWAARAWHEPLGARLDFISNPSWRMVIACAIIFIAAMLAVGIIARILKKIFSFTFIGWLDKLFGSALGLCKGLLLWVLVFMAIANLFPDAAFWRDAQALPYFKSIIEILRPWLPENIANHMTL